MSKHPVRSYYRQAGLSLVNVLVALNVTILCAMACISLYSNHQAAADNVRGLGTLNRQVATSMVVLQKEISSAGFGIDSADTDDIVVINTTSGTNPNQIEMLWRYNSGGTTVCRGVRENQQTIDSIDYRVLSLIEADSTDCDATEALNSMAWSAFAGSNTGILAQWEITTDIATYLTANGTIFNFQVSPASCAPFGMIATSARLAATITAPSLAELNGAVSNTNTSTICLVNTTSS